MANYFSGVQHVYCATFLLTVSHNVSIINDLQRDKVHKKLNDVLDQNVDATKRTSIVDNLFLLQQYKYKKIKIQCHN